MIKKGNESYFTIEEIEDAARTAKRWWDIERYYTSWPRMYEYLDALPEEAGGFKMNQTTVCLKELQTVLEKYKCELNTRDFYRGHPGYEKEPRITLEPINIEVDFQPINLGKWVDGRRHGGPKQGD